MTDSRQRPKINDRVEDLPTAAQPAGNKKVSPTESGNVKGGARSNPGTNDDSI